MTGLIYAHINTKKTQQPQIVVVPKKKRQNIFLKILLRLEYVNTISLVFGESSRYLRFVLLFIIRFFRYCV